MGEGSPVTTERSSAIDLALARGVLYGAVAHVFQHPARRAPALGKPDATPVIRQAASLLDSTVPEAEPLLPTVRQFTEVSSRVLGDRAADHERLFGHTARGLVCPYETEFGSDATFQQPQALADIAGYYNAFGLRRRSASDERIDHIGCECEFVEFLALKEAYALEAEAAGREGYLETLNETRRAGHGFLRDHLGRFGLAFATALTNADEHGVFGRTGKFLFRLLEVDCARFGIIPGPHTLQLRSAREETVPMGCGGEQELIQIQRGRS
jgi:TorA maturation chaperone TorD